MDLATLRAILRKYGHERVELEFRLGHRQGTSFVPGVSASAWENLNKVLDSSPDFALVTAKTQELICHDGCVPGGKYVIHQPDPTGTHTPDPHWIYKKRLLDHDEESPPWTCRTSVSLEEVSTTTPAPSRHAFRRNKERWSYLHKCWSVDLTKVHSNLPHQLDNDGLSYEVEIELKDTTELFARPLEHIVEWGRSIAHDLARMCLVTE